VTERRQGVPKQTITSERGAPPLGAYSQGWRAGDFIFVTGTVPIGPDGAVAGDTIGEQTHLTIDNIEAVLEAGGATLADVVKVNVYLNEVGLFPLFNEAYKERFSQPYPVRTTVGSDLSHLPGALIEMDCVAYVGE
jgi:2-iminobutanoate/2-iminopropanoate deaminase